MITLKLNLSPIDGRKFNIWADKYHKEESDLPFSDGDTDPNLFTVLNALNTLDGKYKSSKSDDKNWMLQEGLLIKKNKVSFSFHPEMRENIGKKLYKALFIGKIKDALHQALGQASLTETQERLHIQLQYEADAIQISKLPLYPWQLVHDEQEFLAQKQVIFSYLIAHKNSLSKGKRRVEQVKVLLISSTAFENQSQKIQLQEPAIAQGLKKAQQEHRADLLSWHQLAEKPTFPRLQTYLTDHINESSKLPDIIHFNGHGFFKKQCNTPSCIKDHSNESIYPRNTNKCKFCQSSLNKPQGFLLFDDDNAEYKYISAERFAHVVNISKPALVVITACKSALAYESDSVFNGIAQRLLREVPAVVATPFNISEDSITKFIEQFYRTLLGAKQSLLEAVKLASDAMCYYDYEWYRPVIFMRYEGNEDGYLFEFVDSSETKSEKKLDEQQQPKSNILHNIPYSGSDKYFCGREKELEKLHQRLQDENRVAITGMGGVGKTELAIQYANHHCQKQSYRGGVCWVHVEENENQEDPNLGFEEVLNFAKAELNLQIPLDYSDLKSQIKYCWKNWPEGNVLLVVDNVTQTNFEKISKHSLLPPNDPRFKVLITTRDKLGLPFVRQDLDVLSQQAGLDMLKSIVGDERVKAELEVAKELCQCLGYLPLALELVGRYLEIEENLKITEILDSFKDKRLNNPALLEKEYAMTDDKNVVDAFELSWKRLDENQKFLGHLLSLFSSSPIPWFLVESAGKEVKESNDLRKARHTLVKLSLIKETAQGAYQLHPLIREFFKDKLELLETEVKEEYKRNFCQAIAEVAREIPQRLTIKKISEFAPITTHIQEATEEALKKYLSDEDIIEPFIGLGRFYAGQGLYTVAEEWYKRCLSTTEELLEKVCSDVVKSQVVKSKNSLAYLYLSLKRYKDAESLYREALNIGKKLLKQEPSDKQNALDVAQSQADLGYLYSLQKCYWKAKPLLESALKIRKKYPEKNSDIVISLSRLAFWYRMQKCFAKAQELYEEARRMTQDLPEDEKSPILAEIYNNLAMNHLAKKDYNEAEYFYREALRLNKELHGDNHLGAATIWRALATLYNEQKFYQKAEEYYLNALEIIEKRLGFHLDMVDILRNLGYLFYDQQRYSEAKFRFLQTLNMIKRLITDQEPSASHNKNTLVKWIEEILYTLEDLVEDKTKNQYIVCQREKIAKFDQKETLDLVRISNEIIAPVLQHLDFDSEI